MIPTSQAFNSRVLMHLNEIVYKDVLTEDHIQGNEIAVDIDNNNEKVPGYILKKDIKQFFIRSGDMCKLPIRINRLPDGKLDTTQVLHGSSTVLHHISHVISVKTPAEDTMSVRELIDGFCNFSHSMPNQFLLWKITCLAAYISRVNFRVATLAAFGKDSVIDCLRDLTNNCVRIDNATFAKLEYVIKFPFIVCNEVASLKPDEKKEFESFGLSVGAFQNTYVKRSRKTNNTKEIYDISKLSLGFTFNEAAYYRKIGSKSFDDCFPEQFLDRFLPLKFDGQINVQQFKKEGEIDFVKECELNLDFYKKCIKKIAHLIKHPIQAKYDIQWTFDKKRGRHEKSFSTICMIISHYAKNKEEYIALCGELYACYHKYLKEELGQEIEVCEEKV